MITNTKKIEEIARFVERITGIKFGELKEKNRTPEIVKARNLLVYISRIEKIGFTELGRALGKDHTSIMHSYAKEKDNEQFREFFEMYSKNYRNIDSGVIRLKLAGRYAHIRDKYDNKCVVCGFDEVVEVHHIIPRHLGGSDDPTNLVLLCPNHHALADKGMLYIKDINRKNSYQQYPQP